MSDKKIQDFNDPNNSAEVEQKHRLRMSIDIHSIKDHHFRGLIYTQYSAMPDYGLPQFKSTPSLEIIKPNVEEKFPNSFRAGIFQATISSLKPKFEGRQLQIETWHNDRLQQDIKIGQTTIDLSALLKAPKQKTANSHAQVFDSFHPIDQLDEDGNISTQIGAIRVILYLEDLGPSEVLKNKEKELGIFQPQPFSDDAVKNEGTENSDLDINSSQPAILLSDNLQSIGIGPSNGGGRAGTSDDPEQQSIIGDLANLEHKIIWELETWKQGEEAQFKLVMKQKEVEYLEKVSNQCQQKELEQEKAFKRAEASIAMLQGQLKAQANQLQKREQKLEQVEEEMKARITDTARQINFKDEQIATLKKQFKDDRTEFEKEKAGLQIKNNEQKEELNRLRKQYEAFQKEQDSSPVSLMKNEVNNKILEIKALTKEIEQTNGVKDQYKIYYEQAKSELQNIQSQFDTYREESQNQSQDQYNKLSDENQQLREELNQTKYELAMANINLKKGENEENDENQDYANYKQSVQRANNNQKNEQTNQNSTMPNKSESMEGPSYNWDKDNFTQLERLLQERDYLLSTGDYTPSDPLIIELNNQIQMLRAD